MYAIWCYDKPIFPTNGSWLSDSEGRRYTFLTKEEAESAALKHYQVIFFKDIQNICQIEYINSNISKSEIVSLLKNLSDKDREEVSIKFCCRCNVFIGDMKDWTGGNYCISCSPDPKD